MQELAIENRSSNIEARSPLGPSLMETISLIVSGKLILISVPQLQNSYFNFSFILLLSLRVVPMLFFYSPTYQGTLISHQQISH